MNEEAEQVTDTQSMKKPVARGRPISSESKLGRILNERQLRAYAVCAAAGINPRTFTEYCAARMEFTDKDLLSLCRVLEVEPWQLIEDDTTQHREYVDPLTDSEQTLPARNTKSIEDLKRQHRQMMRDRQ